MYEYDRGSTDDALKSVENAKSFTEEIPSDLNKAKELKESVKVDGLDFLDSNEYIQVISILSSYDSIIREMMSEAEYNLIMESLEMGQPEKLVVYVNSGKISAESFINFAAVYYKGLSKNDAINTYKTISIGDETKALISLGFNVSFAEGCKNQILKNIINNELYCTNEGLSYANSAYNGVFALFGLKVQTYREMPLYNQEDYGNVPYGFTGKTIKESGCGITCTAMILTEALGNEWTPDKCASLIDYSKCKEKTNVELMLQPFETLGISYEKKETKDIMDALRAGKRVIAMTNNSGHFVVLRGLTEDGKVLINDPYGPWQSKNDIEGRVLNLNESGSIIENEKGITSGSIWVIDTPANDGVNMRDYVFSEPSTLLNNPNVNITEKEKESLINQYNAKNNNSNSLKDDELKIVTLPSSRNDKMTIVNLSQDNENQNVIITNLSNTTIDKTAPVKQATIGSNSTYEDTVPIKQTTVVSNQTYKDATTVQNE